MKRALRIIGITIASIILLTAVLLVTLSFPRVQTAIAAHITAQLSEVLGAEAHIRQVDCRFPTRLSVQGVYIADQEQDTLLYIDHIAAHYRPWALLRHQIRFSDIEVQHARLYAHRLADSTYNYQFLIDRLRQDRKRESEMSQMVCAPDIRLHDIRLVYDDWDATIAHASLALHHLSTHQLDAQICQLQGRVTREGYDDTPLVIENLQARLLRSDEHYTLSTLRITLPHSTFDAGGVTIDLPTRREHQAIDWSELYAAVRLHRADIRPRDLAILLPSSLGQIDKQVRITGHLRGHIDDISASDLSLIYDDNTLVAGNVHLTGLPELDSLTMQASFEQLYINPDILEDLISQLRGEPYSLPSILRNLGDVRYSGRAEGTAHDLTLNGAFHTQLGQIRTDGRLLIDSLMTHTHIAGLISTPDFRLGRLFPKYDLDRVSLSLSVNADLPSDGTPHGELSARVHRIDYRGYTYHDILLSGNLSPEDCHANLTVDDPFLRLQMNGHVRFDQIPEADATLTVEHFQPARLHLISEQRDIAMRFQAQTHIKNFDPDHLNGELTIDSLVLRNGDDSLYMQQLQVLAEADPTGSRAEVNKSLTINSDFLSGKVSGTYAYTTLANSIKKQLVRYLPSLYSPEQAAAIRSLTCNNDLQFYLYGYDLQTIERVLDLPFRTQGTPVIRGRIQDAKARYELTGKLSRIWTSAHQQIQDIDFALNNSDGVSLRLEACIPPDTLCLVPQDRATGVENIHIPGMHADMLTTLRPDQIQLSLSLHPDEGYDAIGSTNISRCDLRMGAKLHRYHGAPFLTLHIDPSSFEQNGNRYHLQACDITYGVADRVLSVNGFRIGSDEQFLSIDGVASTSASDSLSIVLGHINPKPIMPFLLPANVLTIQGQLDGAIQLYSLFSTPMIAGTVDLTNGGINDTPLGDAHARVTVDRDNRALLITGDVIRDSALLAHVDGHVVPARRFWQLDVAANDFPLEFINHWTYSFLDNVGGSAFGNIRIIGDNGHVEVLTRALARDAHLTIPYTGCTYTFTDSVILDTGRIVFPLIHLRDKEDNPILLRGELRHNSFMNWLLDFTVDVDHAIAFDLPDKMGEFMSGKVYALGKAHMYGSDTDLRLDVNGTTVGKSRFRLNFDSYSSTSKSSFITFVEHEDEEDLFEDNHRPRDHFFHWDRHMHDHVQSSAMKFAMTINVDATQDALAQMVIDERAGDILQGRGDGTFRFTYEYPSEVYGMTGTYTAQSGSLGFTVGNAIRRDFSIAPGSQVIFNGDAENPTMNVTAKHSVVASLRDLFGSEISGLGSGRTSVPVNTLIYLTGTLNNPIVHFGLELPSSEEAVQNQMRSVVNTEEMLIRQVIYLLVFGRFYTPEYMQNTAATGVNEVYSLLSSTITGQINSWLGKLTDVLSVGVNIRTEGEGAGSSQEYEAQFQLQPMDRLIINGNLGYRYNDISNRPFFGDIDLEYMLTESGKVRVKAYTHTVDKYSLRQASTIQGVGFVFRHDFNWPWFNSKKKHVSSTTRRRAARH